MPLGIRARGVFIDGRPRSDGRDGEAEILEVRPLIALGVVNGEPEVRVGDDNVRDIVGLELKPWFFRVGLSAPTSRSREFNCCAVIVMYLDAREPSVIFSVRVSVVGLEVGVLNGLERRLPMVLGVIRPFNIALVERLPTDGVTLPLEKEADGVREVEKIDGVVLPEFAGVDLPPREEATDEGRGTTLGPTVGADSFVVATNTPHLFEHEKYCFLSGERSALSMILKGNDRWSSN